MVNRLGVIATAFALAGFTIGTAFTVAIPPASAQQVVTCESNNRQRRTCRTDTRNGVRLVRQLSDSRCRGNWGYGRNFIWVRNGCRAQFLVGSRRNDRYNRSDRYDRRNDRRYDRRNDRNDRRYDRYDGGRR